MTEIPTADWTWINAAADRFERAWKAGERPKIEDYLAEVDESRRPRLLEELLRVEIELRRRAGEEPTERRVSRAVSGPCRNRRCGLRRGAESATSRATMNHRREGKPETISIDRCCGTSSTRWP